MAAVDYFLKLDGIDGESTDAKHPKTIELESWSWGETNAGSFASGTGGGGSGRVAMQDFHFVMKVNKASPALFVKCAIGEHIKSANFYARKAGGEQLDFLEITFSDLLVSSYQTGGSSGSDILPQEQISLNFSKIQMDYRPQKPDGKLDAKVSSGYDLKTNKKV
jgi:type VI secretion system secreted protein Hcp